MSSTGFTAVQRKTIEHGEMAEMPGKNPAKMPKRSQSEPPAGRKPDDRDRDRDRDEADRQDRFQLSAHIFVVVSVTFSPLIGFCWRLILISLYFTYHYSSFVFHFLRDPPRRWSHVPQFVAKTVVHGVVLVVLTSWCISITPIHVIAPTMMDLWTPYTVHPAFRNTEVMYDAGSSAVVDIFAIHGLGSNPDSAWAHRTGNETRVHWLRDLLPAAEGLQDIRVVLVNHQTRWDSNTANLGLQHHASELLEHIKDLHTANPERPIVFIAHSFGGILLKKALLLAKARSRDVAAMTKGIIFLGVPHRGTNAAFVASCLSCMAFFRGSSSDLLELMSVDGPELLDLESEFYDAYVIQYHSQDIQPYICDILEKRPEKIGKLVLGSIVRPKHGQLRHGRLLDLDTDHRGLNKFQSHDDPNFQTFLKVLWQAYEHALQNSLPPEEKFPPPLVPIAEPEPEPKKKNTTAHDLLVMAVLGMPWAKMSMLTAAGLYGLEDLTAAWLARDRGRSGSYFTPRVPKMVAYGALVHVPLGNLLKWLLHAAFRGRTSLLSQGLQILIINLLIVPLLTVVHITAMALIAGARTFHQVRATVRTIFRHMTFILWTLLPISLACAHLFLPESAWVPACNLVFFLVGTYADARTKKRRLAALRRMHGLGRDDGEDDGKAHRPGSRSSESPFRGYTLARAASRRRSLSSFSRASASSSDMAEPL